MGQSADFFISYTSADRAWAEWIAWQLEAEGYQVIVQAWDFAPGRDWVHEMHQAAATAERVVAVLSAAYLNSAHGEAEWQVFYAKDPRGKQGLLLLVRICEVEPPGLLKTRIYVDLVGKDAASARAELLAAARGTRGKPAAEPMFPGAPGHPGGRGTQAPRFPGEQESRGQNIAGVHQWVWPRNHGSAQSQHVFRPNTLEWPTAPPLDALQATLVEWAHDQRWLPPSVFEGQLTALDTSTIQLRVAAAFDNRHETPVEEHPGPVPGQPEMYDGRLQYARLSIDYGERRWQERSDWYGVRRSPLKQECPRCTDGKVKCEACNGSGKIVVRPTGPCSECHGEGFPITYAIKPDGEMEYRRYRCPSCDGTGMAGPIRWPCQDCSDGLSMCPRCMGHRYLSSFYWGQLKRKIVQFRIWVPDNYDLRRVTSHYKLIRHTLGWPDLSDLPGEVQRDANARLEELLVKERDRTLGPNSVVYHLETQLFVLPAVQVPYEESKTAYLIGQHWEVYAPDERRLGVRVKRASVVAQRALRAWLDRNSSQLRRAWPIPNRAVLAFTIALTLFLLVQLIARR